MAKLIPAAERLIRARQLIQKAREMPLPVERGRNDLAYIASVRDLLRQARDMIKFISMTPSATVEVKAEVMKIREEINQADREITG